MGRWIAAATLTFAGIPLMVAVWFTALLAGSCHTIDPADACVAPAAAARADPADVNLGRPAGEGGPITDAELAAIGRAIGRPVPTYSILRDHTAYGTGWGGPSVNLLAPAMKVAVARLEVAMGARLQLWSGYRTAGYQAQLCTRVTGPCADPGESMHQYGLAVDAINWAKTLPHLDSVGLCQPARPTTPTTYPTSPAANADPPRHVPVPVPPDGLGSSSPPMSRRSRSCAAISCVTKVRSAQAPCRCCHWWLPGPPTEPGVHGKAHRALLTSLGR